MTIKANSVGTTLGRLVKYYFFRPTKQTMQENTNIKQILMHFKMHGLTLMWETFSHEWSKVRDIGFAKKKSQHITWPGTNSIYKIIPIWWPFIDFQLLEIMSNKI